MSVCFAVISIGKQIMCKCKHFGHEATQTETPLLKRPLYQTSRFAPGNSPDLLRLITRLKGGVTDSLDGAESTEP